MMTQHRKDKRKNDDYPGESRFSIMSIVASLLRRMWRYGVVAPTRAIWQITQWVLRQVWTGTQWVASGAWSGTKWAASLLWIVTTFAVMTPLHGLNWLINGTEPEFETVREREIYRRIHRRYRRRNFFLLHVAIFFASNVTLWLLALGSTGLLYLDRYIAITLSWAFVLAVHHMRVRSGNLEDEELRDALDAEYARQQQERPYYEEDIYAEYTEPLPYKRLVQRLDEIEPDSHEYQNHSSERKQKRRG